MGTWISKMFHALGGENAPHVDVLGTLLQVQRSRAKLTLELSSAGHTMVLLTTIEQVRDDDFIISQPTIGGVTHPLAFGETIKMGFVLASKHHSGDTRCLGRIRIPAGGDAQVLYAYRMALPESISAFERREHQRSDFAFDQVIEAQLYAPGTMSGPIIGRVLDLSMTGARIATPLAARLIQPGKSVYLKAMLPEPGGLLDELVNIVRIEPAGDGSAMTYIGVRFAQRIDSIARLLRAAHQAV